MSAEHLDTGENVVTIKAPCLNCGDATETKIHTLDNTSITWVCSKCGVMCNVPRDQVYLHSFTPGDLIKDAPPTAEVTVTPFYVNRKSYTPDVLRSRPSSEEI